jgi:hypothetical protein
MEGITELVAPSEQTILKVIKWLVDNEITIVGMIFLLLFYKTRY